MGISQVAGDQGLEPFLACCVPELEAVVFGFVEDVFSQEVDSDSGLPITMRTWAVS